MNKIEIKKLQQDLDVVELEKYLIFSFGIKNKINFSDSSLISNYLYNFEPKAHFLNRIDKLEISNLKELESYLEIIIPENDRKYNGAFFTPNFIVDFIIKEIEPQKNDRNIDLSCGTGAFLLGLVDYYKKNYNKPIKKTIKENIFGVDILRYNYNRAKLILTIYGLINNEIIEEVDFNIYIGNSLKINWNEKYDNVIGNPPYVKYQDLDIELRNELVENWETCKKGTYNLFFSFFELGYKLLKKYGKLGYITPNNYFTSLAAKQLRKYFTEEKCIYKIVDFNSKKVFNAQTYTALTFINKKKNENILFARIKKEQKPEDFLNNIRYSKNRLSDLNIKKWRLLREEEQENIKIIENKGTSLKYLFDIKVGIATLKDELYFIDARKENGKFYIKEYENHFFKIEKDITKTIYKISDFEDQEGYKKNYRRIIFPYKKVNGRYQVYSEQEIRNKFPSTFEYFVYIKKELEKRDKGKKEIKPFYTYGRSQGINKYGVKILTPTFSKKPKFSLITDENSLFCNGYGLFLKDNNETDLFQEKEELNINIILKILCSEIMNYYVSRTSVSIEGDYSCYQKNFIEKFTIPSFQPEEVIELEKLMDKKQIDKLLIKKYHLNLPLPNLRS